MLRWLINGAVTLDHLVEVGYLMFFPCKVTIFPSVIGNYLGGDTLTIHFA